jgi:hypothetical protein
LRHIGKDVQGAVELLYEKSEEPAEGDGYKRQGRNATSPTEAERASPIIA